MAFDLKGNELAEGDEVVVRAKVVKTTEGSQNVGLETLEPKDRPGMKTTLAIRGDSIEKNSATPTTKAKA